MTQAIRFDLQEKDVATYRSAASEAEMIDLSRNAKAVAQYAAMNVRFCPVDA